jgi:hypothetical protein
MNTKNIKITLNILVFALINSIVQAEEKVSIFPYPLGYISIDSIHPGQNRYASKNVEQKIKEAIKKGYAVEKTGGGYTLKFDKTPFDYYVLVDGHHDLIAALTLGASTIPVKIVDDLSVGAFEKLKGASQRKVEREFWKKAEENNYVYLIDLDGKRKIAPSKFLKDGKITLHDDPNRYFAAISARKCDKRGQSVGESKGYEYPLWVKIGKDIPFIEFRISDHMIKHGIMYNYAMGDNPSREFVNKVRESLRNDSIPGLRLIEHETYYEDINKENGGLCNLP